MFELQQRAQSPSQSYFKHTVYGLRFLLKTEDLPYDYLHLPAIPKEKKAASYFESSRDMAHASTCRFTQTSPFNWFDLWLWSRCMEVRNIELKHLDFDRKLLHIVQSKGKKDRYVPLSDHLIRGIKNIFQ